MNTVAIFKKGKGLFGGVNQSVGADDIFIIGGTITSGSSSSGDTLTNGIVSGNGVAWIENLDYEVTPYVFNINNVQYSTARRLITLDPSDPTLNRIDVIVATYDGSGNGTIGVVKGALAVNAVKPTLTSYQLEITTINVDAGVTEADITTIVIYDEDAEFLTNDNTSGRVNFDSTENVFSQTKSIKATDFTTGDEMSFIGAEFNPNDYDVLQFLISASAKWEYNGEIEVALYNNTIKVSNWVKIDGDPYNTDGNDVFFQSGNSSWQTIVIPIFKLNPGSNAANKLVIRKTSLGTDTFYLDLIRLQQGISAVNAYLKPENVVRNGDYIIFKAPGNTNEEELEVGDLVSGWLNTTMFFKFAKYEGGDIHDENSFDPLDYEINP